MKRSLCFIKLVFILTVSFSVFASEGEKEYTNKPGEEKHTEGVHKKLFLNYKPPLGRSMPVNREGAGTRGEGDEEQYLAVLVPDHLALTSNNQPSFCWYLSKPTSVSIEITINDETSFEPVLETSIDGSAKEGIQCLGLSKYNIKLMPDVAYQWFITIVSDSEQRSKDISATGMVKYVEPSKALNAKLAKAVGFEVPAIYAEEGLWYDAMSSISGLIDANPDDKTLREVRTALLEQVGLSAVKE